MIDHKFLPPILKRTVNYCCHIVFFLFTFKYFKEQAEEVLHQAVTILKRANFHFNNMYNFHALLFMLISNLAGNRGEIVC
jgi:hypothetical protein